MNRRYTKEGKAHLCKTHETIDKAPSNLLERNTICVDAAMFKIFGKNIKLQAESASKKKASTSSPPSKNPKKQATANRLPTKPFGSGWKDTSMDGLLSSDDEEKKDEENVITDRFKSRFAQRKIESKIKQNNLTSVTKSAKMKAEAMHAHGQAAVISSKIDAIKTAYDFGIPANRIKGFLLNTLEHAFNNTPQNIVVAAGQEKGKKGGENEKKRNYTEIIELDPTPEEREAEQRKRLAMWDAYQKQQQSYEYLTRHMPRSDPYSTPHQPSNNTSPGMKSSPSTPSRPQAARAATKTHPKRIARCPRSPNPSRSQS